MKTKALLLSVALALPATLALAQGPGDRPPGGPPPPRGDRGRPPRPPRPPGDNPDANGPKRGEQPPPGHQPPPLPLLKALDADDDGIISADEIAKAPEALKKLDKNNDGKLTAEEFLPPHRGDGPPPREQGDRPRGNAERPPRKDGDKPDREKAPAAAGDDAKRDRPPGDHPPLPQLITALDANGDHTISAEEIAGATAALKALDQNNDGQLGPREYGPNHPRGDGDQPKPKKYDPSADPK